MKSFHNQLALITGGSSGIGLALAVELTRLGASVWILARRPELLRQTQEKLEQARIHPGQSCGALSADVSDPESVAGALRQLEQAAGIPDLLINSAGVAHPGVSESLPLEIFRWNMEVNYFGSVYVTQTLLPAMIRRGSGHIVNVSSLAGVLGLYGYSAYGPSKYAIRGYSDVLRAELKPLGIRVSVVFPADVQTPQLEYENRFKPAVTKELGGGGGLMTSETAAKHIVKGIRRNRYIITPGVQSTLFYYLVHFTGNLIYPVMDLLIAQAMRKNDLSKDDAGHQDRANPKQVGDQ